MKSIWVCILSAATVTAYLHVKHQQPLVTPVRHEFVRPAQTATPTSARDIVIAPFDGGEVGARLHETPLQDSNADSRWKN